MQCLAAVTEGRADGAAIDSNVLSLCRRASTELKAALRVVESWGPFPIQPVIVRAALPLDLKADLRRALLSLHQNRGPQLARFGFSHFTGVGESFYDPVRGPSGRRLAGAAPIG